MTNYEKNKELLDMYAVANVSWGVDGSGKVSECDGCTDCIFHGEGSCPQKRLEWLQQEYKEPEVDWSKVEIDTPILVRRYENNMWMKRNFAGYIGGKVCTFDGGKTSEHYYSITSWEHAKLADKEDER